MNRIGFQSYGFREEHSFDILNCLVVVARNYWDVGAMILAGFALSDYHNEILGSLREGVAVVAGITGLIGGGFKGDENRFHRNVAVGIASWAGFYCLGLETPLNADIGKYGAAGIMAEISLIFDSKRRRNAKNSAEIVNSNSI